MRNLCPAKNNQNLYKYIFIDVQTIWNEYIYIFPHICLCSLYKYIKLFKEIMLLYIKFYLLHYLQINEKDYYSFYSL